MPRVNFAWPLLVWLVCAEWANFFFQWCHSAHVRLTVQPFQWMIGFFFILWHSTKDYSYVTLCLPESKLNCPTFWKNFPQKYLIWNCCPFWRAVKEKMKLVILNPFVDLLIMVCIILNTLFLAMEYPGMKRDYQKLISLSDQVSQVYVRVKMELQPCIYPISRKTFSVTFFSEFHFCLSRSSPWFLP